jgi:replicative DNA helicase
LEDKLSNSLQENILTLLVFDSKSIPLIINSVEISLFESFIFRDIATQAINFYKEFKKPVSEHLPDTLETELHSKDRGKSELYKEVIKNLYESKDSLNRDYVLSQLNKFIRLQNLKLGVLEAAELLDSGNSEEAELVLENSRKNRVSMFDIGTKFSDTKNVLRFLNTIDDFILTGIVELDKLGICPASKELFTFAGLSSAGKTWFVIQLAKTALLLRKKVLHISLEMSEEKLCMRYMQSFFGFAKRDTQVKVPIFNLEDTGRLLNFDFDMVKPTGTFDQKNIKKVLKNKLKKMRNLNLIVKDFSTGSLTIAGFKTYLESLIEFHNFIPDLILFDEPDLMKLDRDRIRLDIRQNYIDLRGIACDYNLSMVAVSQVNRSGKGVKWLDDRHLSEDYNKMRTSDNLVTYNQTDSEYAYNLARLLVVKGRGDKKGDKILISQNYAMGQFCLDSVLMTRNYWDLIPKDEEEDFSNKRTKKS